MVLVRSTDHSYTVIPCGWPVFKEFRQIGDAIMRHGIADRDWPMILDMIAAGFGLRGVDLDVVEFEVLARRQETRLRFNAPTPVESWEIRLQVRLPKAEFRGGEALLFHWVVDGEWELVELDF